MKTGMIIGESNDAYHGNNAVSTSTIKDFIKSPLLYYRKHVLKCVERKETAAMAFGSLAHCVVLEPKKFSDEYVIEPKLAPKKPTPAQRKSFESEKPTPQATASCEFWDEFCKKNIDKKVVSFDDVRRAVSLKKHVYANPTAEILLKNGVAEVSWRINTGEFFMQSRTDWFIESASAGQVAELQKSGIDIKEGQPVIVDLKTTQELDAWFRGNYGNAIYQFGYQLQLAFYLAVINKIRKAEGKEIVRHFLFVVVEKNEPHDCAVIALDERSFAMAQTQLKHYLAKLTKCYHSGIWEGYKDRGVMIAGVPEQIAQREEEEIFDAKIYEDPSKW